MLIFAFAAVFSAAWSTPETLSPSQTFAQCRRIVQFADRETVEPCKDGKLAAKGRAWLETETRISTRSVDLSLEVAEPRIVLPWAHAGTASAAGLSSDAEEQIEWFASSGTFRRYAPPGEEVRLPEGTAIAILRRRGEIVAVTKPLTIRRHAAQQAVWDRPAAEAGNVVALLTWPQNERETKERTAALMLSTGTSHRPPDVIFQTDEVLLGIWYAVDAGEQTLEVQSSIVRMMDNAVSLRRGSLYALEDQLRSLPKLTVTAGPAADESWPALTVLIRDMVTGASLRETSVRLGEPVVLEHLPPRQLQVVLSAGNAWRFARPADLRNTEHGTVDFALSPFPVTGKLLQADRAVKGTISFLSDEKWFPIETDARGEFAFDAWSPARYIYEVRLADAMSEPAYSSNVVLSATSPEVVIRLPSERLRLQVTDGETELPVPDSVVGVRNRWIDPTHGRRGVSSRFKVDAEGKVTLPPVHVGDVELKVEAPGYVPHEQNLVITAGTDQRIRVALKREVSSAIRILLPNGGPAVGAEAIALNQGATDGWRGTADSDGQLQVPTRFRGAFLILRHAQAASSILLLDDVVVPRGTIRLSAPGSPLQIEAEGSRAAVPSVVLWLDGIRLDAAASAFAAWSPLPFVDNSGMWRGRNLPAGDLRLLVAASWSIQRVNAGALDAMSTVVKYPWAELVRVPMTD